MNPQAAAAFFAAHRVQILGGGAAVVAAAGLYARKKRTAGAAAPGVTAGATIPGTIPAAAVVGGTSAAVYDSTAADLYDLQSQLSDLQSQQQTTTGGTPAPAPAPIASTLLAPTWNGNLGRWGTTIGEIEPDGSVLRLNGDQLNAYNAHITPTTTQLATDPAQMPQSWSIRENLAGLYPQAPATPTTTTAKTGA